MSLSDELAAYANFLPIYNSQSFKTVPGILWSEPPLKAVTFPRPFEHFFKKCHYGFSKIKTVNKVYYEP